MQIKFIPFEDPTNDRLIRPAPAIQNLPDWYKRKRPFTDESKTTKVTPDHRKNISVKWCNPFGDSLGSGYFIFLENDVQVSIENGIQNFVWLRGGDSFISTHNKNQIADDMIPAGFNSQPFKFLNQWAIQTPQGYSTLFTHPLNRTDLPFQTLSGVVDTDDYNLPVNFPFVIKEEFEGILETGTPIAQVIPFRREKWTAEFVDYDEEKTKAMQSNFDRKIHRPYKLGYWKKKSYM